MRILGGRDRIGRFVAVPVGLLAAGALIAHPVLPGGSLLPTFLPWLGLSVPLLLALAVWRRSGIALAAALFPLVAWLALFGGHLLPAGEPEPDLVAVQHNVSDENPDVPGTVRTLLAAGPDLVALEEVTPQALPAYRAAFPAAYPHHTVQGTVALWSRYPLAGAAPLDIRPAGLGPDWNRGLRAVARTPLGDVAVYVVHLPSVRPGSGGLDADRRDDSARRLGAALGAEPLDRVILLGDLNATTKDRGLEPVTARLGTAESGFAFSWPAALPVARIDHVLARSLTVTSVRALPRTGSDHLPVVARLRW
ncbi:endonuclease/exonuclease/phosphatase family protein [Actinoplanes sp. NPDC049802]|uniref:endonuclease/exonuclease/phosphatase family protein n=1 Tax=Actinoplanes sp. NPDC049802 TaxID=3154742 RepID=UPI0033C6080B